MSKLAVDFFPQNVTCFFVCVTLSGLVRISEMRYGWKDVSLLKLLLNNLIALTEARWVKEGKYALFHRERI